MLSVSINLEMLDRLDKIISYCFYLLFFLTPLFWTSLNYELFEYNKMILTYAVTVVIVGAWILKMVEEKKLLIKRTPLDIPLLLFLGANILSTLFSIDLHTSIWGYYSRSNGGLLSIISYLLLYWAYSSNMDFAKVKNTLFFGLLSGFVISIWAILEHFGVSPSCVILRGELNDSCWIQDVQARVFASLGQPNWLAVYLSMLIFPALYFYLTAKTTLEKIIFYVLSLSFYLAFTFTYSRGPTLGLIAGILLLALSGRIKYVATILLGFLVINLLFGSALTSFRLVSKFAAPVRPGINLPNTPSGTQLENGGTESGQIRFIVWQGAWEIFKHYPLFGSGLETFAYSYYQFRPSSHNLTSEWDFLYNKAHNEYLNYLSTTGLIGFVTYILVIGTFLFWCFKRILKPKNLLITALLASYISYLIYNFFLFSVVIVAIFFFLFPALVFVATDSIKSLQLPKFLILPIYRRPNYTKATKGLVMIITLFLLFSVFKIWYADTLFAKGERASEAGNPGRAYNYLLAASELNQFEPFYKSELAFTAAEAAASLTESDATLSAQLKDEAITQTEKVLKNSPKNVSFFRTAVRTYFELATFDGSFMNKTLQVLDTAINLAPTDPKLLYNKALVLDALNKKDEEIKALNEAIKLKPNYVEALVQLKEATTSAKP